MMKDFLEALSKRVKHNTTSFDSYLRMYVPSGVPLKEKPNAPLKTVNLFHHIQVYLKFSVYKRTHRYSQAAFIFGVS